MGRKQGKNKYARDMALIKGGQQWAFWLIAAVLLILVPWLMERVGSGSWMAWLNYTLITIIAVLGLNIITGMTGQISLGHAAFVMVGGYVLGALTLKAGWPYWAAFPLAALIPAILGLLVAIPAMRLRGFYVAVATLAFFFIAQFVIGKMDFMGGTNGLIGIPYPEILNLKIRSDLNWYYLLLPFVVFGVIAAANLRRSRLGRAMMAVRDNEIAAASLGINVRLTKMRAFFIGSLYAGLAGGLWAGYISVVRLDQFDFWQSIWFLAMIIVGGAGSVGGAIMGVVFLRLAEQLLHVLGTSGVLPLSTTTTFYTTYILFGVVLILFVTLKPYGLISIWQRFRVNYKRWPFGV